MFYYLNSCIILYVGGEMKKRILIAGGGTLGHILPIIPIVEALQDEYSFIFLGTKKGLEKKYLEENKLNSLFTKLFFLDMDGINRKNPFKNLITIIKYLKIKRQIKKIYKEYNPSLVIGMGGYISGCAIHIATHLKIKTILHEQNSVLGLANKLVYKKVNYLLLSFPIDSLKEHNIKVIGNPRYSYVLENYVSKDYFNDLLIVGGSLGSKKINDIIIKNIVKFKEFNVTIITGNQYYKDNIEIINNVMNKYKNVKIYPFVNEMVTLMSNASIIISRSGATTINEIMGLRKCAILIPSPNVTENHQYYNAKFLKDNNACILIEEEKLTEEELLKSVFLLYNNYGYKTKLENNIKHLITNNPKLEFIKVIRELV